PGRHPGDDGDTPWTGTLPAPHTPELAGRGLRRPSRPPRRRDLKPPFFGRQPQDLVLHRQLADLAFRLREAPVPLGPGTLLFQTLLARLQKVGPPRRKAMRFHPHLPGHVLQRLARNSRNTTSILRFADHLGFDRKSPASSLDTDMSTTMLAPLYRLSNDS